MVTDPGNRFVFHSGAHKMNCCNLNAGLHTHQSTGNLKKTLQLFSILIVLTVSLGGITNTKIP